MAASPLSANVPQAEKIWDLSAKDIPGKVLILNQVNFERFRTRSGSQVDAEKLEKTFTALNFEVDVQTDLKKCEILDVVKNYAAMSYSGYGCLVICIMTHGQSNGKLLAQNKSYHISKVWGPLKESRSLRGIPKIFFIQACRSSDELENRNSREIYEVRSAAKIDATSLSPILLPHDKEFFFGFSTVEGKVSFRLTETGSFFIQQLCQRIKQMNEDNIDLLTMMTRVTHDVTQVEAGTLNSTYASKGECIIFGQTPVFVSFLNQKIYLKGPHVAKPVETNEYVVPEDNPGVVFILYDEHNELGMKQLELCFEQLDFTVVSEFVENGSVFQQKLRNISSICSSKTASMFLVVLTSLDENTLPKLGNFTFEDCMKLSMYYPKLLGKPKIFMFIDTQEKSQTVQRDGTGQTNPHYNENSDILQFICFNYACYNRLWVLLQILSLRRDDILNVLTRALQGSVTSTHGHMSYIESTLRHKLVLGPKNIIKTEKLQILDKLQANVQLSTANNVSDILFKDVCEEYCKIGEYKKMKHVIAEVYEYYHNGSPDELKVKVKNEVLIKQRQILGDNHVDTLETLYSLGYSLNELKRYKDALPLEEKCLEERRRVLGEEHKITLITMHNLGYTLGQLGRHKDALSLYEKCLEKKRRVLGEEHESTLITMHQIGNTLTLLGCHKDALPMYEECLEKRRRVLGEEHESILTTMHEIGYTLGKLGRHKEALNLYEQCLEKERWVLGDEHKCTLATMHQVSFKLNELGRYNDALSMYWVCLQKQRHVLGKDHESTWPQCII